jgi:hypothetical protein
MNEEQAAIDAWFESDEGRSLSDVTTIMSQVNKTDSQYLRNRLYRAFTAGMKAGRQIEREEIEGRLLKLLRGQK